MSLKKIFAAPAASGPPPPPPNYGTQFVRRIISPTPAWRAIIWDGTRFVAVGGSNNGTVATSTDAINWTVTTQVLAALTSTQRSGSGLSMAGSLYVYWGASATLLTSPNLVTWTVRSYPTVIVPIGFASSPSIHVIASTVGGLIMSSPDGITWTTRQTSSTSARFIGVVRFNNNFYAYTGSQVAVSADGITWAPLQTSSIGGAAGGAYVAVATNGSIIVAVGPSNGYATSTDGINWTQRTWASTSSMSGITWTGSRFVTTPMSLDIARPWVPMVSADGLTWTPATVSGTQLRGESIFSNGVAGGPNLIVAIASGNIAFTSPP